MTTWNKDQPAGTLKVREADDYIRANNDALQDALSRQHTFPGTYGSTAGKHTPGEVSVLLVDTKTNLGTGTGTTGAVSYASDTGLMYRDTGTGISQITSIPSGTKMYFYQDSSPTGWTLDTSVADKLLAVKGGSQAYNTTGGTLAGTWTAGLIAESHVLTTSEIPSHKHAMGHDPSGAGSYARWWGTAASARRNSHSSYTTAYAGGGGGHTHNVTSTATWRPYGAVGIISTKD